MNSQTPAVPGKKHDCQEAAANWAQRQESAKAETGAINKAIEIMSSSATQSGSDHLPSLIQKSPALAQLRSDTDAPNCTKSRTDNVDPRRAMPNREKFDPMRAKLRMDIAEPRCKKSITDTAEPMRMKLRTDSDDPRCK